MLSLRAVALLATIAIMSVALFPPAAIPIDSTRSPVSAFRAIPTDAVEFTLVAVVLLAVLSVIVALVWHVNSAATEPVPEHSLALTLRC